ncbi:MAG: hypothetical protein SFV55_17625 [Haliscomenobacter sp.]|uniref:hypothetical protein n=1 Tax=Haliscomenobacter sp. TaxID=2717303 RepID=UPI0029B529DC|nr:hypothetical protein [Haliscomenobacter sp.]MDX2070252.1 hypothetical protein [Haliscomenobacter sp.]
MKNSTFKTIFLISLLSLNSLFNVFGQIEQGLPIPETINAVAKYAQAGGDRTIQLLQSYGYSPPVQLQNEWVRYPSVRKITMAYQAAEAASPGNGEKLLAMLSKDMAQKYQGILSEKPLAKFFGNISTEISKITFKTALASSNVNLADDIKKSIMAISKYTESGALGGTRGILKFHFEIHDDNLFDILNKSKTHTEALEKGISLAKSPPPPQERLKNVTQQLYKCYEGARTDKALNSIAENPYKNQTRSLNPNTPKIPNPQPPGPSSVDAASNYQNPTIKNSSVEKYNKFLDNNYGGQSSRKMGFRNVVRTRAGFGGVILGDTVVASSTLPKLESVRWISNEIDKSSLPTGVLEFIFVDGSERIFPSVNLEDAYAGYTIAFNNPTNNKLEEAHGLAGIYERYDSNNMTRWEVILHPVIENLELGLIALMCDVLPIADEELKEKIRDCNCDTNSRVEKWLNGYLPSTWKITDVPIFIDQSGSFLTLKRMDIEQNSKEIDQSLITMHGFGLFGTESQEEREFYSISPILIKSTREYERLNDFVKVFALMRWAKFSNATFLNPPVPNEWIKTPERVWLSEGRVLLNPNIGTSKFKRANTGNSGFLGEAAADRDLNGVIAPAIPQTTFFKGVSKYDTLSYLSSEDTYTGNYYRIQLEAPYFKDFLVDHPKYSFISQIGKLDTEFLTNKNMVRVLISGFEEKSNAIAALHEARKNGFSQAFIVYYKNGNRYGKVSDK